MLTPVRGLVLLASLVAVVGCRSRTLTAHPHFVDHCVPGQDGTAILCGGTTFASLECQAGSFDGCTRLTLRYADGDVARLYEARGDPKFDKAVQVIVASDGGRVWFLETEGPFGTQQWHEYDVQTGALRALGQGDGERTVAAAQGGRKVRFVAETQVPPSNARAFFGGQIASEVLADWFSRVLGRMDEPALVPANASARVHRFTVLPTWGPPVTVRLTLTDTTGLIVAKRLSGLGGYEPGRLRERRSARVDAAGGKDFVALFGRLGFQRMESEDPVAGKDGSVWILESVESGEYHVVERWSPHYDTDERGLRPFVDACEWLFRASPLDDDVLNKGTVELAKHPR